jgi:hypothetical protein
MEGCVENRSGLGMVNTQSLPLTSAAPLKAATTAFAYWAKRRFAATETHPKPRWR